MPVAGGRSVELAASAARTASASGTAVEVGAWKTAIITFAMAVADTDATDTLDVFVDVLGPDGVTWLNAVHFAQAGGTDTAFAQFAVLTPSAASTTVKYTDLDQSAGDILNALNGPSLRARWAIVDDGADNASFTFSVHAYLI